MKLSTVLGKKSAKGSFDLFLGIVIQSVILAVGAIILGRMLGSAFYGLYTLSYVPVSFIGLFAGFGIRNATIRYASLHNHHNRQKEVKETIVVGLLFTVLVGLLLAVLCFALSNTIAVVLGRADATFLIQLMSLCIFSEAVIIAIQGGFIGVERTRCYSAIIIIKATIQASLGPILILTIWPPSSFGPLGAVVGLTSASLITCAVAAAISYFLVIRQFGPSFNELELLKTFKTMLRYGIPLYISRVVNGFLKQFLSIIMVLFATDVLIGNYQVSLNFTVLVTFFLTPISTVLFPAFSKLDFKKDKETMRTVFRASVKYTALLILPLTFLIIVLSSPLVSTFYGESYQSAPLFLSLAVIGSLYAGLGQFSITALLNGQGETRKNMILGVLQVAVGLPLALVLVPNFQITGLIIATLISGIPQVVLGSIWIKRLYNVTIDWFATGKIFLLSAVTASITYASLNLTVLPNWMQLFVGAAVLSVVFIVFAPLLGVIDSRDIQNLRMIFSGTKLASAILNFPLKIMLRLCR
jgi:O-antigen/teichoic acid export membrane protein